MVLVVFDIGLVMALPDFLGTILGLVVVFFIVSSHNFFVSLCVEVIVANVWIPFTNAWDFQLCRNLTYIVGDFGMDILISTCVLSDCDLYLTPGFGLLIPLRFLLQISCD